MQELAQTGECGFEEVGLDVGVDEGDQLLHHRAVPLQIAAGRRRHDRVPSADPSEDVRGFAHPWPILELFIRGAVPAGDVQSERLPQDVSRGSELVREILSLVAFHTPPSIGSRLVGQKSSE